VIVDVREAPLHTLRLGGGVAIDQVRHEARLVGGWSSANFLGGLRRLSLEVVAGWAFIPTTLAVVRDKVDEAPRHGPIARATADFHQPRFLSRPSLAVDGLLEAERTLEPTYDAIGARGRLSVPWRPPWPSRPPHRPTDGGCSLEMTFVVSSVDASVATGPKGYHFHREHRCPGSGGESGGVSDLARVCAAT
jgi:hypothetical protein